jgi:hypothetical protein
MLCRMDEVASEYGLTPPRSPRSSASSTSSRTLAPRAAKWNLSDWFRDLKLEDEELQEYLFLMGSLLGRIMSPAPIERDDSRLKRWIARKQLSLAETGANPIVIGAGVSSLANAGDLQVQATATTEAVASVVAVAWPCLPSQHFPPLAEVRTAPPPMEGNVEMVKQTETDQFGGENDV